MKKVINGKLYDTDKAKRLGYDGGGDGFTRWSEELYQKRTGEFFLYGEGGAKTQYAEYVEGPGGGWTSGAMIMTLSYGAARKWAEKHLSADEYEEIFDLPSEDAEPVALNIQIDAVLMARIKEKAAEDGASLTATVAALLENGLENAY